jgi:hypothetical protein
MSRLESGATMRPVPSVTDSLDRVVDAAQHVVVDHIALLRVEASAALASATRRAAPLLIAGVLMVIGWILLLMAAFQIIAPRVGSLGTLALLAGANLVPGLGLVLASRRGTAERPHG